MNKTAPPLHCARCGIPLGNSYTILGNRPLCERCVELKTYPRTKWTTARKEMTDAKKLEILADWFDTMDAQKRWGEGEKRNEVQRDLRRIARRLRRIDAKGGKL